MSWRELFRSEDVVLGEKLVLLGGVGEFAPGEQNVEVTVSDVLDGRDYRVKLLTRFVHGVSREVATCTCSAGLQCMHAAAARIGWERRAEQPERLPGETPRLPTSPVSVASAPLVTDDRSLGADFSLTTDRTQVKCRPALGPGKFPTYWKNSQVPKVFRDAAAGSLGNPGPSEPFLLNLRGAQELLDWLDERKAPCFYNGHPLAWSKDEIALEIDPDFKPRQRDRIRLRPGVYFIGNGMKYYLNTISHEIGRLIRPGPDEFWEKFMAMRLSTLPQFERGEARLRQEFPPEIVDFAFGKATEDFKALNGPPKRLLSLPWYEVLYTDETGLSGFRLVHEDGSPARRLGDFIPGNLHHLGEIAVQSEGSIVFPLAQLTPKDLSAILQTHRVGCQGQIIQWALPLPFDFQWREIHGFFTPHWSVPAGYNQIKDTMIAFNLTEGIARKLGHDVASDLFQSLQVYSEVPRDDLGKVRARLRDQYPDISERFLPPLPIIDLRVDPQISLVLQMDEDGFPEIALWFKYDNLSHSDCRSDAFLDFADEAKGKIYRLHRNLKAEDAAKASLREQSFIDKQRKGPLLLFLLLTDNLVEIWNHSLQPLRELGWEIVLDPSVGLIALESRDTSLCLETAVQGYTLNCMSHTFQGQVDLMPYLTRKVNQAESVQDLMTELDQIADGEAIELPGEPGQPGLLLPIDKVRSILTHFAELLSIGAKRTPHLSHFAALHLVRDEATIWKCPEALTQHARNLVSPPPAELPQGIKATLRPYQVLGYQWLSLWQSLGLYGILADDMGLGKTLQTITLLLAEKEEGRLDRPTLIVAPTSVLQNWKNELAKFAPGLTVSIWHGSNRPRLQTYGGNDVILTNYALLALNWEELRTLSYHYLICDEAQNIKNPKAIARHTLSHLKTRHRLCLSGTPIENNLGELWSLLDFLNPGILLDEKHFRSFFRRPIEDDGNERRKQMLNRRIRSLMVRRTKKEVATDLPDKQQDVQLIPLHPEQAAVYESIRLACSKDLKDVIGRKGLEHSRIEILAALLKLRQTCCDPRLLKHAMKKIPRSAKLDALMENIRTMIAEGRRILLFSQFTQMLDLMEKDIQSAGIPFVRLDGTTKNRQTLVDKFQNGDVPLFLLSLKAGGAGLNLTAADTVILYDPWWNPAVEDQAVARAHRIGQTQKVFAYRYVAAGTIEERILQMQGKKRELAESTLDGTGGSNQAQLTAQDIDYLLAPITEVTPETDLKYPLDRNSA